MYVEIYKGDPRHAERVSQALWLARIPNETPSARSWPAQRLVTVNERSREQAILIAGRVIKSLPENSNCICSACCTIRAGV